MHFGFDDDEESFRQEVRRFTSKVLAPHYQADHAANCGPRS